MPKQKIEHPKTLETAAWKKAKSIFNNDTGISETLRAAEAAFRAASADIDAINNIYDGNSANGQNLNISGYPAFLADCKRLTNSKAVENYKKSLWTVRDHCKKVATEKSMSSKQKGIVLDMAKTADSQAVFVNANSISGFLSQEAKRWSTAFDSVLEATFGPEKLKAAVGKAVIFLKTVKGQATPEAKLNEFNQGITKAARDITQILMNRIINKYQIPYTASSEEKQAGEGLVKFANNNHAATAKNLDAEIKEMESLLKKAVSAAGAKAPTCKELFGGP
jgi:hypothetical protein